MLEFVFWSCLFLLSLVVLLKAADVFTDSAEKIGLYLKIPSFIVGVTIVSIGTSLPELVSSFVAMGEGYSEMVVSNVVGSNITNIFLVLGVSAILAKKLTVNYDLIHVDLPMFVGSAFLMSLMIMDGEFTFFEGMLSLFAFIIYLLYTFSVQGKDGYDPIKKELKREHPRLGSISTPLTLVLISSVVIFIAANFVVNSVIELSEIFNIGKEIITLLVVAFGTSLPELVVAVEASLKGRSEMVVGSVLGSSIVNSLVVMGLPTVIGTIYVPNNVLTSVLPLMLAATFLYFFITQEKQITKWEGWLLIIFYIFFVGTTLQMAI